jgi:hypothetical protein
MEHGDGFRPKCGFRPRRDLSMGSDGTFRWGLACMILCGCNGSAHLDGDLHIPPSPSPLTRGCQRAHMVLTGESHLLTSHT